MEHQQTVEDGKSIVEAHININKIMIFTKSFCKFSKKAKEILDLHIKGGYGLLEIDSLKKEIQDDIQKEFVRLSGASTVPRLFLNGKFFGGCDDIVNAQEKQQLKPLLASLGSSR